MTPLQKEEFYCTEFAFKKDGIFVVKPYSPVLRPKVFIRLDTGHSLYVITKHLHRNWSSAMEEVERMRAKKLASLEKQFAKVKSKKFKQP